MHAYRRKERPACAWLDGYTRKRLFIHEKEIMHYDPKPENMFVQNGILKLGLSSHLPPLILITVESALCTLGCVNGRLVTFSADVWAFVITCIEISAGVFAHGERGPSSTKTGTNQRHAWLWTAYTHHPLSKQWPFRIREPTSGLHGRAG